MSKTAGRNDLCPCGSGKKFKKCCELKASGGRSNKLMLIVVGLLAAGGIALGVSEMMSDRSHTGTGQVWSPEHGHYH